MRIDGTRRWVALAAGIAVLGVTQTLAAPGVPAAPAPAAAPPSLVRVPAASATDSVSPKTVVAVCPAGKVVLGGGSRVSVPVAADQRKVVVTRLEPVHSGNLDSYVVSAEEIAPGIVGSWQLEAFAICAPALPSYQVVTASTRASSTSVQQTAATCPGTTRTIGSGAQINNPGGQVTLQTNRSDDPLKIIRAVAKEDANGYSAAWNVTSYAVCATLPAGFVVARDGTPTSPEDDKLFFVDCPDGKYVHGAGVATSGLPPSLTSAPPGLAVQWVHPTSSLTRLEVFAVASTPTSDSWDVGAFAICGP